jgi:hypothetical protein
VQTDGGVLFCSNASKVYSGKILCKDNRIRAVCEALQEAARSLRIQLQSIQLRNPYDFKAAFRSAKQREADAMVVLFSPCFTGSVPRSQRWHSKPDYRP